MASPATSGTGDIRTPAWVANVREEISRSPAWEVLSDQLYERVSIALESHGLGHFSDLSSAEQITLLEEAHRDISSEDNKVYKAFESQFGKSMDAEIAKEARARVDQDEAAKRDGTDEALYLDRILDSAAEGAVSLLKELPREHLGSLRLMLNQPVPSRARLDIWRLLLKHTAVREEYELLMKQNRNSTISGQDIYITHRCQALLESGRVASRRLLPLTSLNVVLMKTVLSYHHVRKMGQQGGKATPDIPESFVHFLVPLCAVATSSPSSRSSNAAAGSNVREQKIESQIEELVEMFEGALEAGLAGLVDPNEAAGGAGSIITTRAKKTQKALKTARVVEPPISGGGGGGTGEVVFPFWVDKVHGVLLPGFEGLVDHVTRVHLGLAAAAPMEGGASEHKREGRRDGGDGETSVAAHEKLEAGKGGDHHQQLEGEVAAAPPSPRRVSSISRRAALQSRGGRPSSGASNNSSAGVPTTAAPDNAGGAVEDEKAGDTPMRRRSSIISSGEGADNVKFIPSDNAPLPSVNEAQARAALYALLKPLVTVGLVGYLNADACLFAWDQAVIGGFGVMLPLVAAMVVAAAADKMQACSTFPVMSEALLSHTHIVSTSQLQELMEAHCLPSIRTELQMSHKLSSEIVGPSLKTATEILHSAYSKRTRETQKARKAHVEHVLGPSKGRPINKINAEERLQLDLPRITTHGSGGSSSGGSSVDLQHDNSSDGGDDDDDDDSSDNARGKKSASSRPSNVKGGLGGRGRESKHRSVGSKKKKSTWRGMLTHRSTSSTVASVDAGGEATSAKAGRGDHGSTRDRHNNKQRKTKKKAEAAAEAPTTSGSAETVRGKKKGNKATGSTGADNVNTKAKTKTSRKGSDHDDPSNESADYANVGDGDGGRNRKNAKRPIAGATAGTRKGSSASSSLAQESTGRSLESSQYFSRESQSSSGSETEGTLGDDEETASRKEGMTHSESRRRKPAKESSTSSVDDDRSVSEDQQTGTKKEKSSSNRMIDRKKTSNATGDSGSGAEGGKQTVGNKAKKRDNSDGRSRRSSHSHVSRRSRERDGREEIRQKSAKGASKTQEASKQEKTRAVAGENTTSGGGAHPPELATAAAAAATSASTSAPKSPLKRWLGFGRKKASSPAKGTKTSRTKTITDVSSWMQD